MKENAEYHAAKEQQAKIEGRVLSINDTIARANVIDVTKLENNVILENDFANLAVRIREVLKPNECNILLNRQIEELKEKMI